jgi:hypothetical protein
MIEIYYLIFLIQFKIQNLKSGKLFLIRINRKIKINNHLF